MRVTVLAGGVGGARFVRGLRGVVDDVTVIANTGDDITLHGLRVCPDLDTLMYTLAGGIDEDRGWGRADETFVTLAELRGYDAPGAWFALGDRDIATHLVRSTALRAGRTLTEVTAELCGRWPGGVRLLPMTDDRVETHVELADGRTVHFQEWWVRLGARVPASRIHLAGAEAARPTAAVRDALATADVVLLAPSNPVVSIGTILAVPGLRDAVRAGPAPVVGLSPIVGGAAVRGMAEACLRTIGVDVDAAAVARHYGRRADGGLLDGWLVDEVDTSAAVALSAERLPTWAVPLLMSDLSATAEMARVALKLAETVRR